MKISIIVPIYNSEENLHRCIESILNQTFVDFELILINDGSKDRSGEICNEYAEKDKRVKVFHKENGGVSSARNIGIENAKGEYSIHVDSDDYVENNMLERLYEVATTTNSDIVICDYFVENNLKINYNTQGGFNNNKDIIFKLISGDLIGSLWNKLIKTNLYRKFSIVFPENITIREDLYICISLLLHNIDVYYLNEAFYHYCINPNSITARVGRKQMENHLNSASAIISILEQHSIYNDLLIAFKLKIRMYIFALSINGQEIKKIYPETNKHLLKEPSLPIWIKIGMSSIIWGYGYNATLILKLRRIIK